MPITRAPRSLSRRAVVAPIPDAEPVTTYVRSMGSPPISALIQDALCLRGGFARGILAAECGGEQVQLCGEGGCVFRRPIAQSALDHPMPLGDQAFVRLRARGGESHDHGPAVCGIGLARDEPGPLEAGELLAHGGA